jgi:20S proteasome alpha/beta subunit
MKVGLCFPIFLCMLWVLSVTDGSSIFYLSMLSAKGRRRWVVKGPDYDQFGRNQAVENTTKLLESSARSIVVARLMNETVVAVARDPPASSSPNNNNEYRQLVKLHPIIPLVNHSLYLVTTGLVADCHLLYSHCQQVISNYTNIYGGPPSALQLSRSLSSYFHQRGHSPLFCQVFLLSVPSEESSTSHAIYEITLNGEVNEILAGMMGKNSENGRKALERSFRGDFCRDQLKPLLHQIFEQGREVDESLVKNTSSSFDIHYMSVG